MDRADCERLVLEALRFLAGVCDGANERDDVGFNGADSAFGRSLAGQSRLSDNQLWTAVRMLQKYRRTQLAGELPTEKDVRMVLLTDCSAVVRYSPGSVATPHHCKPGSVATPHHCKPGSVATPHHCKPGSVAVKTKPIKRGAIAVVEPAADVETLTPECWLSSPHRIGLSEQQQEAFDAAHEWFFSKPEQPFVLAGRAGSGKSFAAQRIAKSLQELTSKFRCRAVRIALTAPTHRARAVLEKFAKQADLACHIATMQSLLYLKPGKADKDGKRKLEVNEFKWKAKQRDPHWSDFGLVINDESSMISSELFSYVQVQKIPVIFMGESYQLPPVEDSEDGKEEKLSPVFDLPCGVKLTHVMRYDGEIAKYVDAVANKIEFGEDFLPRLSKFETRTGNLIKISSRESWEQIMLETFVSGENCRALAWTNKRVSELNNQIREAVMNVSASEQPFVIGDRVMAKEPIMFEQFSSEWFNWHEGSLMQTCDEGKIISVNPIVRDVEDEMHRKLVNWSAMEIEAIQEAAKGSLDVPALELVIACDSGEIVATTVVTGYSKTVIERAYNSLKDTAKSSDDERKRKAYWRAYFHMQDAFSLIDKTGGALQRLQFAFASTCHQAQGGTYDYVFSDHTNFMGCQDAFTRDRLIYTASSRAAKQLIAYSKY